MNHGFLGLKQADLLLQCFKFISIEVTCEIYISAFVEKIVADRDLSCFPIICQ